MSATAFADRDPITAELLALEREERRLSKRRRQLHDRIDRGFPNGITFAEERSVSAERRALHARIDTLRAAS
jgi:hypothetical protein